MSLRLQLLNKRTADNMCSLVGVKFETFVQIFLDQCSICASHKYAESELLVPITFPPLDFQKQQLKKTSGIGQSPSKHH